MIAAAGVGRTSITCQCASISPGISVRPPPSMTTAPARRSAAIGVAETLSMRLPRTRTCDGPESCALLPSKMRTFWISVTAAGGGAAACCAAAGSAKTAASAR